MWQLSVRQPHARCVSQKGAGEPNMDLDIQLRPEQQIMRRLLKEALANWDGNWYGDWVTHPTEDLPPTGESASCP